MREVLGLSLTANAVVWTLVDPVDGTIVADDVVEVDAAEDLADAAAGSVEAFASRTERHIDAIRIAWSKGTAGAAVKLTSKLRSLGFSDVNVITEDEARYGRNRTARYIDPSLELAYGAARTVTAANHDKPLRRMTARLPARRVSIAVASSVVVMAVGAAGAGYLLLDKTPQQAADHASTPVMTAPPPEHAPVVAMPAAAPPPPPAPVVAVPAAAPPPPPAPEVAVASPVVLALPPVEAAAAPTVTDEPEVAPVPEVAASTDTSPAQAQAATVARQPHLTHLAPSAGPTAVPDTASLPDTAAASGPAPATTAGQPHLTPEALSPRLLPGPVPLMSVVGVPAPPAAPPPSPNPFDILAALP
jgi:hypothetical protein